MVRVGLISDTHNYLDEAVFRHFDKCDEIWHGGDFGTVEIANRLKEFRPLKGVYGNIDGYDVRSIYPQKLVWNCEGVTVYMTHIGGYPGRYAPGIKQELVLHSPSPSCSQGLLQYSPLRRLPWVCPAFLSSSLWSR